MLFYTCVVSGRVMWTREEALSGVLSVELVDLPVSNIQAKMEDEFSQKTDLIGDLITNAWNYYQISLLSNHHLHRR